MEVIWFAEENSIQPLKMIRAGDKSREKVLLIQKIEPNEEVSRGGFYYLKNSYKINI